ncbi:anthranilate phosphoribosyltransferase [Candidatus Woesearchaeota archaeon]|jgi:anthranilate phosphoribosyltransferase|nr:anthranilate phosphoribosyltransferase [Candidatus Woesearchaeota archaeon]MDP6647923.1 anthranilate phosphoribosyltransferase [Candidatus Woesearchaeota archaeon]|tara:strand:- start:12851 stop:13861 length:1011 start_codon:yes stop_codon:yes gene_type:complete
MITDIISKLVGKGNITQEEVESVFNEIMEGKATDVQIAGFLVALRLKGETIDDITTCAGLMREKAVKINPKVKNLVDTCGTGGDHSGTFNISTAAAFVASGAGVAVAKHGNRSVSSKCGSADVLRELGVKVELGPDKVEKCIEEVGIGFMFAPIFHPAMKNVAKARKELGVRTIFNILGPLLNPAHAKSQLIGVFDSGLLVTFAEVLKNLGSEHAMIVHGNGLDEITLTGKTKVCELRNGKIETYEINPEEFGFKLTSLNELKGESPSENAKIINDVLSGAKGPKRDIVLLNAAAALLTAEVVKNYKEGIELAANSIDSGNALKKLKDLVNFTNKK